MPFNLAGRKVVMWFLNSYRCLSCQTSWKDEWSATCDDECPNCGKPYTPVRSKEIGLREEVSDWANTN